MIMAYFCISNNFSKMPIKNLVLCQHKYCILNRHASSHSSPGSEEVGERKLDRKECYEILDVPETCSLADLRSCFVSLAKKYHPDGGTETANAAKFARIETAYRRTVREKLRQEENASKEANRKIETEPEDRDYGLKHTAPQHRQYLSYEGVGYGTMSERQKQYQSYKVNRAVETVLEHRTQKIAAQNEASLVFKDKTEAKKHKIRNAIDRLVEDLIQESMAKGDFDNLPGRGKPLKHKLHNPYIDSVTQKLNEVLINNGFTPEWILLEKEIRIEMVRLRFRLEAIRLLFGVQPLNEKESKDWSSKTSGLRDDVAVLNSMINKYNLLVPVLKKQMVHFRLEREAERILKTGKSKFDVHSMCGNVEKSERIDFQASVEGFGSFFGLVSDLFRR